jgi:hypothetical protein
MKIAVIALLSLSAPAFAFTKAQVAVIELKAGLEAHMNGDDASARKHFAVCLKFADTDARESASCRINSQWWAKGVKRDDKKSPPEARAFYKAGIAAYKKGELDDAGRNWYKCFLASAPESSVREDCLAMEDIQPRKGSIEMIADRARWTYLDGADLYKKGDMEGARRKWTQCRKLATPGSQPEVDCGVALGKLKD